MTAKLDAQMTQRVVRLGMIGRSREQALEARGRLGMLPEFGQQFAAM
jgi:hypothetical protein